MFGRSINSQVFGKAQEPKAARHLRSQGLKLLCRNYRCRHSEIDLIMTDSNTLVFVDVRYRRSKHFGGALNFVTSIKQKRFVLQQPLSASSLATAVQLPLRCNRPNTCT
jgi:putative endonuclease